MLFSIHSILQRKWSKHLVYLFMVPCAMCSFWISYVMFSQTNHLHEIFNKRVGHEKLRWLRERQELLTSNSTTKVLLFCYMRGGSSLGGQIFNTDTEAVLWYEPLAAFYAAYYGMKYASKPHHVLYTRNHTRSITDSQELEWIQTYLSNIFNCRLNNLPAQAWLHPFAGNGENLTPIKNCIKVTTSRDPMRKTCPSTMDLCETLDQAKADKCPDILSDGRATLMRKNRRRLTVDKLKLAMLKHVDRDDASTVNRVGVLADNTFCVDNLRKKNMACVHEGMDVCRKKTLHVAEVLRFKMEDAEAILLRNPDMFIVHYVRDPRGIALSRISTAHLMVDSNKRNVWYEADCICKQMRLDIKHRKRIESQYPGTVVQVRYEDLVLNPVDTVRDLYRDIGRRLTSTSSWMDFAAHAFSSSGGERQFGTVRQNGSDSVNKWRTDISNTDLLKIKTSCRDVFADLGYPLI